jgi:DnaJ-class molecular chaperone
MPLTRTRTFCRLCDGVGLLVESAREGYHIYRQCPTCKGKGYHHDEENE